MPNKMDKDMIESVAFLLSLTLGLVFSVLFAIQGEFILGFGVFLVGVGGSFLLTGHGRTAVKLRLGFTSRRQQNESSPSTKQCPNCDWHNHQGNRNCVECEVSFE